MNYTIFFTPNAILVYTAIAALIIIIRQNMKDKSETLDELINGKD